MLAATLAMRLRQLQSAQRFLLGDGGERDLVAHGQELQRNFDALHSNVHQTFGQIDQRMRTAEARLDEAISNSAVIRYDAYNELSGRQSSSIALLDERGNGVVMSSILHRDQARVYVKGVHGGKSELELSPEESEAIQTALGRPVAS